MIRNLLFIFFSLAIFMSSAQEYSREELMEMSLKDLIDVKVTTGNITGVKIKNSPSAITIITNEQIQISQAKNLGDVLEIYVPGLILMTHSEGNKIGIRGLIAAENYKLLLLVNGQNLTNLTYEGVITEIDMWDMNDIERVEVIRGPGSVTYGTGAIAGVINIITKTGTKATPTFKGGINYNPTYRSKGGYFHYSKKTDKFGLYAYTSIQKTTGQENPSYYRMNGDLTDDNRYIGEGEDNNAQAQDYLADGLDRPQIKAHIDFQVKDNFRVWTRYTQSGQTHNMTSKRLITDENGLVIDQQNRRHVSTRAFSIFPKYDLKLSKKSTLKSTLGYDSQEYIRYDFSNTDYDWDHYNNIRDYAFLKPDYLLSRL